jgi:hypothetical protein
MICWIKMNAPGFFVEGGKMAGYSKLFSEIVTSSIWSEDDKTRIVWITMLALKDSRGFVPAALPGLANAARVTVEECEAAVAKLETPDKYSRTAEHEGRRIQHVEGGWMVLNHEKYREKRSDEERREYQRRWQAEHRRRQNVDHVDTNVDTCRPPLTYADAYTYTDTDKKKKEPLFDIPQELQTPEFLKAWDDWMKHRKEIRKALTPQSVKMQMKDFSAWGVVRAIAAIEHTIKKGWQGIREPDNMSPVSQKPRPAPRDRKREYEKAVWQITRSLREINETKLNQDDRQRAIEALSDKYRDVPGALKEALEIMTSRPAGAEG